MNLKPINRLQKILSRSKLDKNTGCMIFTGRIDPNSGYGKIGLNGKNRNAHRAVLILKTDIDPKNKDACHSCDNRSCINPDHIWWGTRKENIIDMIKKGRAVINHPRGEDHPGSKLTYKKLKEIKKLLSQSKSHPDIAKKFNVSRQTITAINTRQNWGTKK